MRVIPILALVLAAQSAGFPSAAPFDRHFTADTMRVDYFHTGGPKSGETFALDRVLNDGEWPGSRTQLIDATNLGAYLFEVHDTATGTLLYSRGFASIYGEWETTPEAKTTHRTFHESLRFPWPRQPVSIVLQKRQADNRFARIWSTEIDPASRFVNRAPLRQHTGTVWPVFESGPAREKVDLLDDGGGLHRRRAAEVPRRRQAAGRRALRQGTVQEQTGRLQRPGARHRVADKRRESARTPASSIARRFGANTTCSTRSATC